MPQIATTARYPKITRQPFILVTTGGGGDGDELMDWVIAAYEADPTLDMPALLLFGPFINRDRRRAFLDRIARHPKLDSLTFDNKIELLMQKADAIVGMGGYNTFCEILSFDKRALIVPRTRPRLEQHIRAVETQRLGLVRMLSDMDEARTPERMAAALRNLADQPRPSDVVIPGLLDGIDRIKERIAAIIDDPRQGIAATRQAAE
jgi:predicted glycosyltransferase